MVVLVDAEDRENEGDLIIPAQMATPDAVNFMARFGRGLICLAITGTRAADLGLSEMVRSNQSRNRTAFTQSIEAREGISTGISAHDRALTIATAIDPSKDAEHIVSPGHVFPLVAREGGVLIRAGHTEASVDLARLAGLNPAAVICEIMNDDGTMARLPDLKVFAREHGLKIGTIEDLIAYRLQNDRIVTQVAEKAVESTYGGDFRMHVYETHVDPAEHIALIKGDISQAGPVLVRVHAVNPLADLAGIGSTHPDGLIEQSLRMIAQAGTGVLVLIRDIRPRAVTDWIRTSNGGSPEETDDRRKSRQVEIGVGSQILADLGVKDMILLTNSPQQNYVGLEAFGLRIVETRTIG
ncbi:MAG: 3,4-dihydroxy-2-butanone-4-phosphate synthase [Alphaproteobacteria bacterium]|nr:3,4-dihydroxy-2-butanone-4-phosphate synthase [Alphaproteobacteria bacterium]